MVPLQKKKTCQQIMEKDDELQATNVHNKQHNVCKTQSTEEQTNEQVAATMIIMPTNQACSTEVQTAD